MEWDRVARSTSAQNRPLSAIHRLFSDQDRSPAYPRQIPPWLLIRHSGHCLIRLNITAISFWEHVKHCVSLSLLHNRTVPSPHAMKTANRIDTAKRDNMLTAISFRLLYQLTSSECDTACTMTAARCKLRLYRDRLQTICRRAAVTMPPPRHATEARSGSLEWGRPSRARSANTRHPPNRPAAHAARRPDVCDRRQTDRRQTASSFNAPGRGHNKWVTAPPRL